MFWLYTKNKILSIFWVFMHHTKKVLRQFLLFQKQYHCVLYCTTHKKKLYSDYDNMYCMTTFHKMTTEEKKKL